MDTLQKRDGDMLDGLSMLPDCLLSSSYTTSAIPLRSIHLELFPQCQQTYMRDECDKAVASGKACLHRVLATLGSIGHWTK